MVWVGLGWFGLGWVEILASQGLGYGSVWVADLRSLLFKYTASQYTGDATYYNHYYLITDSHAHPIVMQLYTVLAVPIFRK